MTPNRRTDDPRPDVTAEEADAWIGGLPQAIEQQKLSRAEVQRALEALEKGRRQNRRVSKQARAIGLVVFAVLIVLGFAFQRVLHGLDTAADRDRQNAFEQCQLVNDNAMHLNRFLDVAVASVKSNTALTPAEKDYRVSLYLSIKQRLPLCERP